MSERDHFDRMDRFTQEFHHGSGRYSSSLNGTNEQQEQQEGLPSSNHGVGGLGQYGHQLMSRGHPNGFDSQQHPPSAHNSVYLRDPAMSMGAPMGLSNFNPHGQHGQLGNGLQQRSTSPGDQQPSHGASQQPPSMFFPGSGQPPGNGGPGGGASSHSASLGSLQNPSARESSDPRVRAAGLAVAAAEEQYRSALLNLRMMFGDQNPGAGSGPGSGPGGPLSMPPSFLNHGNGNDGLMSPGADIGNPGSIPGGGPVGGSHPSAFVGMNPMDQMEMRAAMNSHHASSDLPPSHSQGFSHPHPNPHHHGMKIPPAFDPRPSHAQGNMSIMVNGQNQELTDHPYSFLLNDIRRNKRPLSASEYGMHFQSDKKDKKKKPKLSGDAPRRPLTAYNFFFSEEREVILAQLPEPGAEKKDATTADGEQNDNGGSGEESAGGSTSKEKITENIIASMRELPEDEMEELKTKIKANTDRILKTHKESDRVKKSHRKMHGKIPFQTLAKLVGQRWRGLTPERKEDYENLARVDMQRFETHMKKYEEDQQNGAVGGNGSNTNSNSNNSISASGHETKSIETDSSDLKLE